MNYPINEKERLLCQDCFQIRGGQWLCSKAYYFHMDRKILFPDRRAHLIGITPV